MPIVLIFGSGVGYILIPHIPYYTLGSWYDDMQPHTYASFFQAPWLIGTSTFFSLIVLYNESIQRPASRTLAGMSLLFMMLSYCQGLAALVLSGSFFGAALIHHTIGILRRTGEANHLLSAMSCLFLLTLIFVFIFQCLTY